MILRERIVNILQSKYTVYDRFRWKLDTLPKQVFTGGGGLVLGPVGA
jgi:hypothetical protein